MTTKEINSEFSPALPFVDHRNIVVGKARVIWARAVDHRPEGWVLPGGLRTDNFAEAHGVAVRMNELCNQVATA